MRIQIRASKLIKKHRPNLIKGLHLLFLSQDFQKEISKTDFQGAVSLVLPVEIEKVFLALKKTNALGLSNLLLWSLKL